MHPSGLLCTNRAQYRRHAVWMHASCAPSLRYLADASDSAQELAHGSFPARRPAGHHLVRQSGRYRRLRVRRVRPSRAREACRAVRAHGLRAGRQAQDQGHHGLAAGRHQLHPQRRAAVVRRAFRGDAWAVRGIDGLARRARPARLRARGEERRRALHRFGRHAGGAGHQGHRRVADVFVDRYGAMGSPYDREFDWLGRVQPEARGRRLLLPRSPHAQRLSRQHGQVVRLLRQAVQLPPDPLLRHRGQADRPALARADQPLRPHPHSHQQVRRRQEPDRGVPEEISRRGHPAHRRRHRAPV